MTKGIKSLESVLLGLFTGMTWRVLALYVDLCSIRLAGWKW